MWMSSKIFRVKQRVKKRQNFKILNIFLEILFLVFQKKNPKPPACFVFNYESNLKWDRILVFLYENLTGFYCTAIYSY